MVLLVCVAVRVGAELIDPVLPLLGGLAAVAIVVLWLFGGRGPGGGYR